MASAPRAQSRRPTGADQCRASPCATAGSPRTRGSARLLGRRRVAAKRREAAQALAWTRTHGIASDSAAASLIGCRAVSGIALRSGRIATSAWVCLRTKRRRVATRSREAAQVLEGTRTHGISSGSAATSLIGCRVVSGVALSSGRITAYARASRRAKRRRVAERSWAEALALEWARTHGIGSESAGAPPIGCQAVSGIALRSGRVSATARVTLRAGRRRVAARSWEAAHAPERTRTHGSASLGASALTIRCACFLRSNRAPAAAAQRRRAAARPTQHRLNACTTRRLVSFARD
jgi:hypothetical protein